MRDIIDVTLCEDHFLKCKTYSIARNGEGLTPCLSIAIPEKLCKYWAYIDFKKPNGDTFKTPRIDVVDGKVTYNIPGAVLNADGGLEVQVVFQNENNEIWKSYVKEFAVRYSINATDDIPDQEDFITNAQKLVDEAVETSKRVEERANSGEFNGKDGVVDYSLVSNALKGGSMGNVVPIKDISPIPHQIKVNVEIPEYKTVAEKDVASDETISFEPLTEWVITTGLANEGLILNFEDGSEWHSYGALEIMGSAKYLKVEYQNGVVTQYFYNDDSMTDMYNSYTEETTLFSLVGVSFWEDVHIKVETKFEDSVKVDVYGKNLFNNDTSLIAKHSFRGSSTSTPVEYWGYVIPLVKGKYTAHAEGERSSYIYGALLDTDGVRQATVNIVASKDIKDITFDALDGYSLFMYYGVKDQTKATAQTNFGYFNIQIEAGSTATEYEPYKEPESYIANDSGKVDIPYKCASMTLVSNTEMSVEYNRDINKAFAELQTALISMGGNV